MYYNSSIIITGSVALLAKTFLNLLFKIYTQPLRDHSTVELL
nr:MAG TPA: hypothetical protein [Caudoviricetes sp.]